MSNPLPSSPEPVQIVLVRKLILLILLMVTAALGLLLLLRHSYIYSPLLPHLLSDTAVGLIAGFSARWILDRQTAFLRIVASLAFLIGALELLGWFTGWQIGLSLQFGRASVDWLGLGQLLLGTGVAILAMYAWVQPVLTIEAAPTPLPVRRPQRSRRIPEKRPRRSITPSPVTGKISRADRAARVKTAEALAKPKRRRSFQPKPQLQLAAEGDNRCPYCLEPIIPDDPRGVVECKICHTLHHADCWAITGACQVPHYTA
ncbi:MAG TPA: hypothetical protein VMC09_08205 [Anaerolineales bacterium]|nr:hypothetical protein [Anaerolineales bacterium]